MNGIGKDGYINKLKNKIFRILCEYEKDEGGVWEEPLDAILTELLAYEENDRTIDYFIIWYKLSSARYLSHKYFRKNILDVLGLLSKREG